MAPHRESKGGGRGDRWRIAAWSAVVAVVSLPWAAMQISDKVRWDLADFALAGLLLVGLGIACELTVRSTRDRARRAAVGVALGATLLLVWMNLAVGIIGSEDDPANLMYGGVLAVGAVGAAIARFRSQGMAWTLAAMALAQMLVAAIALIAGLGSPGSGPLEILTLNGVFAALWLASAWLFQKAVR
jgi:hypothetical protein